MQHPLTAILAPTGVLRASINLGNSILAHRDAAGSAQGVSVDLAGALAQRLGISLARVVFDTARESVQAAREGRADLGFFAAAAGVRQQLAADAARVGGLRMLEPAVMTIRQAMGLPAARGADALAFLCRFVKEMIASGFVADALARHGIEGATVAPAVDG